MTLDKAIKAAAVQLTSCKHAGKNPCEICEPLKALMDAARTLATVEDLMDDFVDAHSDGEGPTNLQFYQLFESVLDVLRGDT